MFTPPAQSRTALLAVALPTAAFVIGCMPNSQPEIHNADPSEGAVVVAEDLLTQSAAAHQRLSTLQATGFLRDHRKGARRIMPIRWVLAKPNSCRLQLDMDLAIVLNEQWWTYRADDDRIRAHRLFTKTPIETAGTLLSDGIAFLLPSLFLRGEAAMERDRFGRFTGWRLLGAGWSGASPCYVFEKTDAAYKPSSVMRLSIDQKSLLIRSWMLEAVREDGSRRMLLEISYTELIPNVVLPSDAFQIRPPSPIPLPVDGEMPDRR